MASELEQFLSDTGEAKVDIMDQPFTPEEGGKPQDPPAEEEVDPAPKNRRERRLMQKLSDERESSIKLAETLAKVTESQKFAQESEGQYLKTIEKVYGTNTAEGLAVTGILKQALRELNETSKKEALNEWRAERAKEVQEIASEARKLENMADDIEDSYDLDMTPQVRKAFFTRLEKLSPKDSNGEVIEYADHHAVWEDMQSRIKQRTDNRAKELSSRSMIQSGASSTDPANNATEKFLRDNGVI